MEDPRHPTEARGDLRVAETLGELLTEDAETMLQLCELRDWNWNADSPRELSHSLDDERIDELEGGAEPTEEELEMWNSEVESSSTYWEVVDLYRVSCEERAAWLWLAMDGCHQGSQWIDGAGPFSTMEEAASSLLQHVGGWHAWWCAELADAEEARHVHQLVRARLGEADPRY